MSLGTVPILLKRLIVASATRGKDTPDAMSLRHTESSLPDRPNHIVNNHKPLPYRTTFIKPCYMCSIKDFYHFFQHIG